MAFQSETLEEYKMRIKAAGAYQRGAEIFKNVDDHQSMARISCCKARATRVNFGLNFISKDHIKRR